MTKNKKLFFIKTALIFSILPIVIHAYEFGPDPRRTGAPGDVGTCLGSGCHSGAALNGGPGNVKIVLPGGNTYTPGVKQHIMVQITDSTRQKFGFELTARLASNLSQGQAGDFSTSDAFTQVLCDSGNTKPNGSPCPSSTPVEFIEHTTAGYSASTTGGYTYQFDWTPPATNVGNVTLYVAANAGPGGSPQSTSADVYTANVTLTPVAATTGAPSINTGGIVPVYSSATTVQPGSWVSIYGQNLAAATTVWNGNFPTSLGGVTVSINSKPAYLWFVSAGQINLQAPDDSATGSVPVVVTTSAGSTTSTVTLAPAGPAFLLLGDNRHATGYVYSGDGTQTLLGPTGSAGGARPAKKGEVVALYGVGFGPTNPLVPAGAPYFSAANLVTKPVITVGGVSVPVAFGGIVGAGLYQFNFTIPATVASGDVAVQANVNGVLTPGSVFIPVQ